MVLKYKDKEYEIDNPEKEDIYKVEFTTNGIKVFSKKNKSFAQYNAYDTSKSKRDFINCLCRMKPKLFDGPTVEKINEIFEKKTDHLNLDKRKELSLVIQEILASKISRRDKSIRKAAEAKQIRDYIS